ncbi:ChaB family protein [Rhodococcus sp. NPDC060086]|uniref:ChaB family protein n=1 Tax=unclassified Rhodococcus (in: high G+C Gram-positive bacteria) TaxID=192944 RepID=UPI00364ABE0B
MDRFELPHTLRRSSKEVQEVYGAAYEAAAKRVGEGEDAERAAYGAVKEKYDLENDHWVPKQD